MFEFIDIANEKAIDKLCRETVAHYKSVKARENLHIALDACVRHAIKHNDASKLTNFWTSLPANAPHKLMAAWIGQFTSLRYVKDKKQGKKFLSRDEDGKKIAFTYNLEGQETPFYDMPNAEADKENPQFDAIKLVDNLVKRLFKEADKEGSKLSDAQKDALKAMAGRMNKLEDELLVPAFTVVDNVTGEINFEQKKAA